MTIDLNSQYDCANASSDLPDLMAQLDAVRSSSVSSVEQQDEINRLENQIRFIQNKCDIPHSNH
ncbi:DUF2524 domain-containing protein [Paenibacillus glycanilyticus]|uniref:DUF2524 domain-containing protein n=1 Tax=Paenibacillus glycanilyticus TaxID=126569 RepID=UPI0020423DF4|nr:DUF2524 domain-containing protein [Paenibacillus glycanilyticus]MCM3626384.1 DUF2524 domain-containing protein [Paenibacillus glycanilyticus]